MKHFDKYSITWIHTKLWKKIQWKNFPCNSCWKKVTSGVEFTLITLQNWGFVFQNKTSFVRTFLCWILFDLLMIPELRHLFFLKKKNFISVRFSLYLLLFPLVSNCQNIKVASYLYPLVTLTSGFFWETFSSVHLFFRLSSAVISCHYSTRYTAHLSF